MGKSKLDTVNCCQLQMFSLGDSQILNVTTRNKTPGTWGAAVHRLAKQQKRSLRYSMATNLPGVQAVKLCACVPRKSWQKFNVCVDA